MFKSYKYLIKPSKEQITMLEEHFGACRFIYNWGLELKTKEYQTTGKTLTRYDLSNLLPELKKEHIWLKNINSQSIQSSLKNLDTAYTNFFRNKKGFPKFKSKYNPTQSFQCPQNCSVDFENNTIYIPKVKNIKAKLHRKFEGLIKTITISKHNDKYYASILVDDTKLIPEKLDLEKENSIGLDLGLKHFVITSDGDKYDNPKYLRKSEKKLALLQKRMSKKKLGSSNRNKARKKVAKLHNKIANQRKDYSHKLSYEIVHKSQGAVCMEDLSIKGMVKNHKLAKSINDAGWGMFKEYIIYKCEWYGRHFLDIGRFEPSSKMCSSCGHINSNLKLNDRDWQCFCGVKHDRDINAAKNILNLSFTEQNLIRCIGLEQPNYKPVEKIDRKISESISMKQEAQGSLAPG